MPAAPRLRRLSTGFAGLGVLRLKRTATTTFLSDVGNLLPVKLGIGGNLPAIKRSVASHAGKESPIASLAGATLPASRPLLISLGAFFDRIERAVA